MNDDDTQAQERETTRAKQARREYSDNLRQVRRPKRQKNDPPAAPESDARKPPENP